jgi:hypothetical protein
LGNGRNDTKCKGESKVIPREIKIPREIVMTRESEIKIKLTKQLKELRCTEFFEFVDYLVKQGMVEEFDIVSRNTDFFDAYIKSYKRDCVLDVKRYYD